MHTTESDRLSFIVNRDGPAMALDFAERTYKTYRACLLMKASVLQKRGMREKRPSHATFPEYRRKFIESCLVLRAYIRSKRSIMYFPEPEDYP